MVTSLAKNYIACKIWRDSCRQKLKILAKKIVKMSYKSMSEWSAKIIFSYQKYYTKNFRPIQNFLGEVLQTILERATALPGTSSLFACSYLIQR